MIHLIPLRPLVDYASIMTLLVVLLTLTFDLIGSYRMDTTVKNFYIDDRWCMLYIQPCKRTYQRYFQCKCPDMRPLCVGPGKYYDAQCIPSIQLAYGRWWVRPDQYHMVAQLSNFTVTPDGKFYKKPQNNTTKPEGGGTSVEVLLTEEFFRKDNNVILHFEPPSELKQFDNNFTNTNEIDDL